MKSIRRYDVNEESAHTGLVEVGDFYFLNYCTGNVGQPIEDQINGAFDEMERRLGLVGLTLEAVVKMDCLFRDVWNLPVMEKLSKNALMGNILLERPFRLNLLIKEERKACFSK